VLLQQVRTRRVAFDELADLPGARLFFANVNTPAEYEEAVEENTRQAATRKAKGKS
jgi:molybdopterin-guanine dinucleotide biosynthesis protein A